MIPAPEPQNKLNTTPETVEATQTSSSAERLIRAWKERRFVDCQELLDQIKEPLCPQKKQALFFVVTTQHKSVFPFTFNAEAYRSRVQAMRRLATLPAKEVVPLYANLLFENDDDITQNAMHLIRGYGSEANPFLALRLTKVPNDSKEGNPKGYLRIIELLGNLGTASEVHLLDLVLKGKFPVNYNRNRQTIRWVSGGILTPLFVLLVSFIGGGDRPTSAEELFLGLLLNYLIWYNVFRFLLFIALKPFEVVYRGSIESRYREAVVQALAEIEDVSVAPALIDHIHSKPPASLALKVLHRILKKVTPNDAIFTSENIYALNGIAVDYGAETSLAVLPVLEHFGNTSSLILASRLAQSGATPAIRSEAQRVIPIIQARLDQERERRELLRATETPSDDATTLLRGAKNTYEANPKQELLHVLNEQREDSGLE